MSCSSPFVESAVGSGGESGSGRERPPCDPPTGISERLSGSFGSLQHHLCSHPWILILSGGLALGQVENPSLSEVLAGQGIIVQEIRGCCKGPSSGVFPGISSRQRISGCWNDRSRVRMWRGGLRFGLSVPAPFVWRCLNSRTITPFPHPSHQTGHAELPHPAFGQDLTPSPTARRVQVGSGARVQSARTGARGDTSRPCVA